MRGVTRLAGLVAVLPLLFLTACQTNDPLASLLTSLKPEAGYAPAPEPTPAFAAVTTATKPGPVAAADARVTPAAAPPAAPVAAAPVAAPTTETISTFDQPIETGLASWYGARHNGRKTADGGTFDRRAFTAAHPSLPFGTWLRVVNQSNGRSVDVVVTDRHPEKRGRIIDLSAEAARQIDLLRTGVARVALYLPSTPAVENATPPQMANLPQEKVIAQRPGKPKPPARVSALRPAKPNAAVKPVAAKPPSKPAKKPAKKSVKKP